MFAVRLFKLQRNALRMQAGREKAVRVLQLAAGLVACSTLAGCVTDAERAASLAAAGATPQPDAAMTGPTGEPLTEKEKAMVAQARALAFAEPKPATGAPQIDLGLLAMRANPAATHRIDGAAGPNANADRLPPDQVLARLRALSSNPGASSDAADPNDRSREILARLQELSHRAAPAGDAADLQARAAPPAAKPAKPISPEAVLRRLRELSGAKPQQASGAEGFGGVPAFVPAPEMARPPAAGGTVTAAPEAAR